MLSVSQTADLLDVSRETIRNWTRRGLLVAEFTDMTGHQFYSEEQISYVKEGGQKKWKRPVEC